MREKVNSFKTNGLDPGHPVHNAWRRMAWNRALSYEYSSSLLDTKIKLALHAWVSNGQREATSVGLICDRFRINWISSANLRDQFSQKPCHPDYSSQYILFLDRSRLNRKANNDILVIMQDYGCRNQLYKILWKDFSSMFLWNAECELLEKLAQVWSFCKVCLPHHSTVNLLKLQAFQSSLFQ